jgi:hypothetical protein
VEEVDVELGYMRAHTGRFSSPSVGKGLNLHNIPKHDKIIAKPIREIFRLPSDICFIRADLSNVEYRCEGMLTGCKTVVEMFEPALGGNIFNDPYCQAWYAMTRQKITKKDPLRQVAKAAVLGLGFCMGPTGYAKTLVTAMADKNSGITSDVLLGMGKELNWPIGESNCDAVRKVKNDLACSMEVAVAAYQIHKSFNKAHPEFALTADWLTRCVTRVSSAVDRKTAALLLEQMHESEQAPPSDMLKLSIDSDSTFEKASIRVRCGPWVDTVCWRCPKMRPIGENNEFKLTVLKATGIFKPFTRQLAIENVTQAAARNGLCWGIAELEKLGFPDVLHVHDEILIIAHRTREAVLRAKEAMIKVFGPGSNHPLKWACLVKPDDISVTESMWENEEENKSRWERIVNNSPGCLLQLA